MANIEYTDRESRACEHAQSASLRGGPCQACAQQKEKSE